MDSVQRMFNKLEAGAAITACSSHLNAIEPFTRTRIFTGIFYERLKRKHDYILDLYKNNGQSWEQALFILLFRFLGAPSNTEAFEKLARTITYPVIKSHLHSEISLEALLIGGSGLLDLYPNDEYTHKMRMEFEYLSGKYRLERMTAGEWDTVRILPHNNPVLRLAQAVAILSQPYFDMERVLACRTDEDIERLFMHEASNYWYTHFIPGVESPQVDKRVGKAKADILAINVVAPMQFTYGCYIKSDRLRDRAVNLLDEIKPENNYKVRRWRDNGYLPKSAFETQVLIQLGDEYCNKLRCRECPVGLQMIKRVKETCKLKENK